MCRFIGCPKIPHTAFNPAGNRNRSTGPKKWTFEQVTDDLSLYLLNMKKRLLLKECLDKLMLLGIALLMQGRALAVLAQEKAYPKENAPAQEKPPKKAKAAARHRSHENNLVYVDGQGILRWTKNNTEASFWGVNYTVPFAYSYRAHKALGVDPEQAMREDVYHLSRLGLDAFRVHVWDTEISDSVGNLLENEHLRLFDFLLAELKKRDIRIILTPIAFWGNGYPEKDERTPGFSRVFGKGRATVNDTAIRAQENYLQQFLRHTNPYTQLSYRDDPNVIAVELNNEPSHSGPKSGVTDYINRLVAVMKKNGWTKPLFYNISQNPYYADAVAASGVDGFSFQWYPVGLVAGHESKGNFLPNVDRYPIPFDTIPAFRHRAKMAYEFDAADLLQSDMYPAMARSFRGAGFQWATQFAYDPIRLAYANTEYQTHFLNLAYTPSKAISLLIASRVFHRLPLNKSYGAYPADSVFDVFRVSYRSGLSQMNADTAFYYSNSTQDSPVRPSSLLHLAGVGSSPVVRYDGYGAYFLDRLEPGVWRLEVMPDAIPVSDPFARASPQKEVVRIQWESQRMQVLLPDLGDHFSIRTLNQGNTYSTTATDREFLIRPGAYLIVQRGKENGRWTADSRAGLWRLGEFEAPAPAGRPPILLYDPITEVSAGTPDTLCLSVVGLDPEDSISLQLMGSRLMRAIPFRRNSAYDYSAGLPPGSLTPGIISYRILIQKGNDYYSYPGKYKGNPSDWDNYHQESYELSVVPAGGGLLLYDAATDRHVLAYPAFRRGVESRLIPAGHYGRLVFHLATGERSESAGERGGPDRRGTGPSLLGFQFWFGDRVAGRSSELAGFHTVVIRARCVGEQPVKAKLAIITKDAVSFAGMVTLSSDFRDIEIPVNSLQKDSLLLLPRPYPDFLPLWFNPSGQQAFSLDGAERLQVTIDPGAMGPGAAYGMEVESVWLKK
jgi:hypothetical protein